MLQPVPNTSLYYSLPQASQLDRGGLATEDIMLIRNTDDGRFFMGTNEIVAEQCVGVFIYHKNQAALAHIYPEGDLDTKISNLINILQYNNIPGEEAFFHLVSAYNTTLLEKIKSELNARGLEHEAYSSDDMFIKINVYRDRKGRLVLMIDGGNPLDLKYWEITETGALIPLGQKEQAKKTSSAGYKFTRIPKGTGRLEGKKAGPLSEEEKRFFDSHLYPAFKGVFTEVCL